MKTKPTAIMPSLLLAFCLTLPQIAFSHGEDKAGPHGGFIRMPGAFHTELVPQGPQTFKVYLLDLEWKNPMIVNSNVEITYVGKTSSKANCQAKNQEYFECQFPENFVMGKKGVLKVKAQRELQKGNEASYPLPLKFEKAPETETSHEAHH